MDKGGWFEMVICRYKDDNLFVRVFGNGKKKIIAFHGYGQDGRIFEPLRKHGDEYTVYAFDLFYHGESAHPNPEPPLSHGIFRYFIEDLVRQMGKEKCIVIGFSMGAKYALSMVASHPDLIEKLILIAPDGIRKNFWYALATGSLLTRKIFRFAINRPGYFFKAAVGLEKTGLIDGRVRKFALSQMNTFAKRIKVYNSWIYLRKFFVPPPELAGKIKSYAISTEIVIGKYDRIIALAYVKPLLRAVGYDKLKVVNSGHSNILSNFLAKCFL